MQAAKKEKPWDREHLTPSLFASIFCYNLIKGSQVYVTILILTQKGDLQVVTPILRKE